MGWRRGGDRIRLILGGIALSSYTPPTGKPVVVIVGPEGGVDPAERELLIEAGATAWKLGSTVLRTSSAGPAALALLNSSLGRW